MFAMAAVDREKVKLFAQGAGEAFGMVTMQIVCTGTSLLGVWRWLVLPRLNRSRSYRDDLAMLPVQRIICSSRALQPCPNGESHGR